MLSNRFCVVTITNSNHLDTHIKCTPFNYFNNKKNIGTFFLFFSFAGVNNLNL